MSDTWIGRRLVRYVADQYELARFNLTRRVLARRYLRGSGLEIGALHRPLWVPRRTSVRYVDRMDVTGLRSHYPELNGLPLVTVDLIDDGESLSLQPDSSTDFIIANHFIEHTQDPFGALQAHLRVLRPGGILYLAVPDRRRTFDADRPATPLAHVIRDHREGPGWSRRTHQEEWARLVDKVRDEDVAARVRELDEQDYSIHFHVWTPSEFTELLDHAARESMPFTAEQLASNGQEFIAVLRKT